MKKRFFVGVLAMVLILLLAGCGCDHEWYAATCTDPKTCHLCSETEGEALGHSWQAADCTTAKTCTVCKVTEGEALGHTWQEATTEAPETCSGCALTQGEKLKADPRFTTLATKELQGTWTSEVNMTQEMMGLNAGFANGVDCIMILELGKTGEMLARIELKDEEAFMTELKALTVLMFYDSLQQEGVSKEEADQLVQKNYGMTVEEYISKQLKGYDISAVFQMFKLEGCYYVQDGGFYTADSWKSEFERNEYTLTDGVLVIQELFMDGNKEPLQWKRAE